jgi:hypothetical protein
VHAWKRRQRGEAADGSRCKEGSGDQVGCTCSMLSVFYTAVRYVPYGVQAQVHMIVIWYYLA